MKLRYKDNLFECANWGGFYNICFAGEYDPVLNMLRSDDIVLDAGAGIGTFSILAAKKAKKVYAVEPNPTTYPYLKRNVELNGVGNVIPLNVGLSHKNGTAFLEGEGTGAHLSDKGREIQVGTIDALTPDITAIKMDIEGEEFSALRDQKSIDAVRMMAIETHGTFEELSQFLEAKGFKISLFKLNATQMISRLLSLDFLIDELHTRFAVSRLAVRFFLGGENPIPSCGDRNLRTMYAMRESNFAGLSARL